MRNSDQTLIEAARQARERAQAIYSKFKVGAALLGGEGKIFTGCNIESSSYGLTLCAERVALFLRPFRRENDSLSEWSWSQILRP